MQPVQPIVPGPPPGPEGFTHPRPSPSGAPQASARSAFAAQVGVDPSALPRQRRAHADVGLEPNQVDYVTLNNRLTSAHAAAWFPRPERPRDNLTGLACRLADYRLQHRRIGPATQAIDVCRVAAGIALVACTWGQVMAAARGPADAPFFAPLLGFYLTTGLAADAINALGRLLAADAEAQGRDQLCGDILAALDLQVAP